MARKKVINNYEYIIRIATRNKKKKLREYCKKRQRFNRLLAKCVYTNNQLKYSKCLSLGLQLTLILNYSSVFL